MIALLLALAPAASGGLDQAEEAYLRTVLRRDLSVRAESLTIASTRESKAAADAALGPQLVLSGKAGTSLLGDDRQVGQAFGAAEASQLVASGGTLAASVAGGRTWTDLGDSSATVDTAGVEVSFTQPLLRGLGAGNETLHESRQADLALKVQIQTSRAAVYARLQEARTAFWQQVTYGQILAMRQEDSVYTDGLLAAARSKTVLGAGSDQDSLEALAEHLQALSDLLSARADWRTGWRGLLVQADTSALEFPAPEAGALPGSSGGPALDSAALYRSAIENAPEIAQAMAQVEKSAEAKAFRRNDRLPALDLKALAGRDLVDEYWYAGALATLEWTLPNGASRANYRQALLNLRSSELAREKAKLELASDIGRLVEAVEAARAQEEVASRLAEAKVRVRAVAEAKWKAGSGSWSDFVEARRDALDASASAWKALASTRALEAELEARTGTGAERLGWTTGD